MKKKMHRILFVVVLLALIPTQSAQADTGPKPSMEFEFVYETGSPLQITGGDLMECEDEACTKAHALEDLGPQGFDCDATSCSSLAYGYAGQMYLVVTFSDGVTRESNLFGKEHFDAYYQVRVRADDMLVEETGGHGDPMGYLLAGMIGGVVLFTGLAFALIVTFIIIVVKGKGEASGEGVKTVWFVVAWAIGVVLLLVGALFSSAIPLSAAIELALGWAYTLWRKLRKRMVLTMILIANVVTSLALWILLTGGLSESTWVGLLIGEGLIWLVEAAVLYVPMRKTIKIGEALLLSLVLNAVSFGVGLLLPF
jgi:hypothetical protein